MKEVKLLLTFWPIAFFQICMKDTIKNLFGTGAFSTKTSLLSLFGFMDSFLLQVFFLWHVWWGRPCCGDLSQNGLWDYSVLNVSCKIERGMFFLLSTSGVTQRETERKHVTCWSKSDGCGAPQGRGRGTALIFKHIGESIRRETVGH